MVAVPLAVAAVLLAGVLVGFEVYKSPAPSEPADALARQMGDQEPLPGAALEQTGESNGREAPNSQQEDLEFLDDAWYVEEKFLRFRQLVARDVIKPIYDPRFIPGKLESLDPGELVMGVEINGESKAYPVGPLNNREMVNDVVGGVPVLVTW